VDSAEDNKNPDPLALLALVGLLLIAAACKLFLIPVRLMWYVLDSSREALLRALQALVDHEENRRKRRWYGATWGEALRRYCLTAVGIAAILLAVAAFGASFYPYIIRWVLGHAGSWSEGAAARVLAASRFDDHDDGAGHRPTGIECCICLSEIEMRELANLDSCSHLFCFGCIVETASHGHRSCPQCRARFTTIFRVHPSLSPGGETARDFSPTGAALRAAAAASRPPPPQFPSGADRREVEVMESGVLGAWLIVQVVFWVLFIAYRYFFR
jgi:hypothetical protein